METPPRGAGPGRPFLSVLPRFCPAQPLTRNPVNQTLDPRLSGDPLRVPRRKRKAPDTFSLPRRGNTRRPFSIRRLPNTAAGSSRPPATECCSNSAAPTRRYVVRLTCRGRCTQIINRSRPTSASSSASASTSVTSSSTAPTSRATVSTSRRVWRRWPSRVASACRLRCASRCTAASMWASTTSASSRSRISCGRFAYFALPSKAAQDVRTLVRRRCQESHYPIGDGGRVA